MTEVESSLNTLKSLFNQSIEEDYNNLTTNWKNADWTNKNWYKKFLANHYFIVRHTEKLICLAAARTDLVFLRRGMISHFHDEESHEEMLLSDLNFLESDISEFEEANVSQGVYQSLYHNIEHDCPEAIVGRICALELMASHVIPEIYKKVVDSFGEESATFLKTHAEEDIEHVQKAISGFQKITEIKPEATKHILNQFKQTCYLYSAYLRDI